MNKLTILLILFTFSLVTQAATVNVGYNFNDTPLFNYLDDSNNFGSPGATVPNVSFNRYNLGTVSAGNLSSNNIDIFIASSKLGYSSPQANDLYNFVMTGGNLLIYSDYGDSANVNIVANKFGVSFQNDWTLYSPFEVQSGVEMVTDGPFAVTGPGGFAGDATSRISDLGSYAKAVTKYADPSTITSQALILPGTLGDNAGSVFFFNDWLQDTFNGCANVNTRNIILNYFANASEQTSLTGAVPEPSSILLLALASIACFYKFQK